MKFKEKIGSKLRKWLFYNKKERNGLLVLMFIFLGIYTLGRLYPLYSNASRSLTQEHLDNIKIWESQLDTIRRQSYHNSKDYEALDPISIEEPLKFYFNPNTLSEDSLRLLGIPPNAIRNLNKYLEKGGAIRNPKDLKKVYGMPPNLADDLMPYIKLPARNSGSLYKDREKGYEMDFLQNQRFDDSTHHRSNPSKQPISKEIRTISVAFIDINTADKYQWMQLNGIGEKRADAIVKYRESLGGFHSIEQVKDVFIIPDSVYYAIEPNLQVKTSHKKIPINTIELDSLAKHPYFRYRDAKIIAAYRGNHGPFKGEEDFKKIRAFNEAFYDKVLPYMDFTLVQ